MKIERIAVLGGSGFVGTSLCNLLSGAGYRLRVFTRSRESRRNNLILLPKLDLVALDIHDPNALEVGLNDCDAAINLVGILNERGHDGKGFQHVHTTLAEKLLNACAKNGVRRILQMSALHADAGQGVNHYLRSKGEAETLLHNNPQGIRVTSFQASVIFGPQDRFFNRFATLLRYSPVLPLVCPNARLAPVYVLDVATMMLRALEDAKSYGQRFIVCGDTVYTLHELVRYTLQQLGLRRLIVPLSEGLSRVVGHSFDLLAPMFHAVGSSQPFSTDNYRGLQQDSVAAKSDLSRYNMEATPLESIVPTYLCHD